MAFMGPMRIIKTEYSAFVDSEQMRQEKSEIVSDDLIFPVDPDFLAKNAYSTGAPVSRFVVGFLAKIISSTHIIVQMMRVTQHLKSRLSRCKPDCPR
jgi:pilus assembly protein TadC